MHHIETRIFYHHVKYVSLLLIHRFNKIIFSHHENSDEDSGDSDANSVESELGGSVAGVVEAVLVLEARRVGRRSRRNDPALQQSLVQQHVGLYQSLNHSGDEKLLVLIDEKKLLIMNN